MMSVRSVREGPLSWRLHLHSEPFKSSGSDHSRCSRVYSRISVRHSYTKRNLKLDVVYQNFFTSRNVSAGFLPVLRNRGGSRQLTRVRAENQEVSGGSADDEKEEAISSGQIRVRGTGVEERGVSGKSNALASALVGLFEDFLLELKNETGFDSAVQKDRVVEKYRAFKGRSEELLAVAKEELGPKLEQARDSLRIAFVLVRRRFWPQFVNWNRKELWLDRKQWDAQRIGALVFYLLLFGAFLRGAQMIVFIRNERKIAMELADAFLESVIPEPNQANLRNIKMAAWRATLPERMKKYMVGEDGEYIHDLSLVREHSEEAFSDIGKLIDESDKFTAEDKEELTRYLAELKLAADVKPIDAEESARVSLDVDNLIDVLTEGSSEQIEQLKQQIQESRASLASEKRAARHVQGDAGSQLGHGQKPNWQERLNEWEKILAKLSPKETPGTFAGKKSTKLSWPAVVAQIERAQVEKSMAVKPMKAFWVARKWWKYRPKLPYTYLLDKIENLEVKSALYTEDMKKLYVTMEDGFPSEFVVDIPLDPNLEYLLKTCGVEVDVLHRSDILYLARVVLVLAPSLLIIWYIRAFQYRARQRASEKIYDLLSMNREHLILPEDAPDKARSQYKDVVVGGDVWQVIDEIMIYMRNPMKYHSRRVKLPRGILISGPPGTGKTLLARAIARESGLPFVFASGAEFVESSTGTGTDKVFDIFFTARANAPAFVFIDEIDALAGKSARDDAERRATFEQLLSELDGEPEDTDVDRFAPRQAVILICATNRPDELDEQFMRPGRIDREIYIGLPGEKERIGIFEVHSQGKRIAKDVDFSKLVFRTIGYSGADIRNLINEAGIMAVRKGHEEISQQDLIEVLDKQLFEGMGVVLMDEEQKRVEQKIPGENKRLLAVHEAGHVLLAHLFPSFDWHAFSHLLPGGSESALSVFYPRQDMLERGHTTVGYVKMQMVVAHGGRCAERLVYGDNISDGGQDDLARISAMARELTISPANSRLGLLPMKWRDTLDPPKPPGEVELIPNEWDKSGTHIINMSLELSELFTREVTNYSDETEEIAMTALSQNRPILERLADVLLSNTKLSGFEAEEIIRSMKPVLLPDFMNSPSRLHFQALEEEILPPNITGRYAELDIYPAPLHRS